MFALIERLREWWYGQRTSQITPEKARARVRRGAEYLDRINPDWYRRVNSETLELGDGTHCVLGQLHGAFHLGLGRSRLIAVSSAPRPSLSPVAYGFKCVDGVPEEWQAYDYELLNRAWKDAVRERQAHISSDERDRETTVSGDSLPQIPAEVIATDTRRREGASSDARPRESGA